MSVILSQRPASDELMPVIEMVVPRTIGPSQEFCFASADEPAPARIATPTAKADPTFVSFEVLPRCLISIIRRALAADDWLGRNTRWHCKCASMLPSAPIAATLTA